MASVTCFHAIAPVQVTEGVYTSKNPVEGLVGDVFEKFDPFFSRLAFYLHVPRP